MAMALDVTEEAACGRAGLAALLGSAVAVRNVCNGNKTGTNPGLPASGTGGDSSVTGQQFLQ